jgi:3-oxoacyl-[acyl-carrier-protein] synthase III
MSNSNSNINTNSIKKVQPQPFIRGVGAAIPAIGDKRIAGGKGGTSINVSDTLYYLTKKYQMHNPKSMKYIDRDWARRNLGVETIACANVEHARSIQEEIGVENLTSPIPEDAVSVTEDELAFVAFEEALEKSKLQAKDIDVILRVSPTQSNIYFWDNMRVWKRKYPGLRDNVQMQYHPLGCPGFLFELKLAKQLLCSPDVNNVAIVISNVGSPDADREYLEAHAQDNIMMHWANLVIFGDGASSVIVSSDTKNLPAQVYDVEEIEYRTDNEEWVSKRSEVATTSKDGQQSTRPLYHLNVEGPKLIKGAVDYWGKFLKKNHGFTMDQAKHVAFHTPNTKVLKVLGEHYGITDRLSWLPNTIGNLGPASCITNLHHLLYNSGRVTNDGDTIYGFALGAALGQLDGVFLLKARDTAKSSADMTGPAVTDSNLAMTTRSSGFINVVCEGLRSMFKSYIGLPSPSTTKALRRLSRSVSNIEASLNHEKDWLINSNLLYGA